MRPSRFYGPGAWCVGFFLDAGVGGDGRCGANLNKKLTLSSFNELNYKFS